MQFGEAVVTEVTRGTRCQLVVERHPLRVHGLTHGALDGLLPVSEGQSGIVRERWLIS